MKDPTEGGGTENICYIYNFMTKSWSYNDSIFTDGESYTNPIVDWNDNVVLAHEDIVDTALDLDANFNKDDTVTAASDRRFTGSSSNWEAYDTSATFTDTTSGDAFLLSEHESDTDPEGFKLQDDYLNDNANLLLNGHYRLMARLNHNGSAGDMNGVEIWTKLGGQPVLLTDEIDTVTTEYTIDLQCGNVNADLEIYHEVNNTTEWKMSEVSLKELTLDVNADASSKIMVGDRLKAGNSEGDEEFFVNLVESDKIVVETGYNSTTAADHSSGLSIYSYKAVFKQLSPTSINSAAPAFITKDYDFDEPSRVKKIYKIYITYMNSASGTLTNRMEVAADGFTTFNQTSIATPHSGSTFALTGTFAGSKAYWDVAVFTFDAPFPCQSIALYFNPDAIANGISINDISFEYRTIHKRVS